MGWQLYYAMRNPISNIYIQYIIPISNPIISRTTTDFLFSVHSLFLHHFYLCATHPYFIVSYNFASFVTEKVVCSKLLLFVILYKCVLLLSVYYYYYYAQFPLATTEPKSLIEIRTLYLPCHCFTIYYTRNFPKEHVIFSKKAEQYIPINMNLVKLYHTKICFISSYFSSTCFPNCNCSSSSRHLGTWPFPPTC